MGLTLKIKINKETSSVIHTLKNQSGSLKIVMGRL